MNTFQKFLTGSLNKIFGREVFDGTETEDEAVAKLEGFNITANTDEVTEIVNKAIIGVNADIQAASDSMSDSINEINQRIERLEAENATLRTQLGKLGTKDKEVKDTNTFTFPTVTESKNIKFESVNIGL